MEGVGAKKIVIASTSGLLFTAAAPGSFMPATALVFMVPWLFAAGCLAPRRLFLFSITVWTLAWLAVFRWVPECLTRIYGTPPAGAWAAAVAGSAFLFGLYAAVFFFTAALAARALAGARAGRYGRYGFPVAALAFYAGLPALWVMMEYARGHVFPSINFNTLASFLPSMPALLAPARYAGETGLSALVVLANLLAFSTLEALLSRTWRRLPIVIGAALVLAAIFRLSDVPPQKTCPGPSVAAVQACVPHWRKWQERHMDSVMGEYMTAAESVPDGYVVLWPETSLNFYPVKGDPRADTLARFAGGSGRVILAGGPEYRSVRGGFVYFNTVYRITGEGIEPAYRKERLMPFTEYCPSRMLLGLYHAWYRPTEYSSGAAAGNVPCEFGNERVSIAVCFESTFPDHPAWKRKDTRLVLLFSDDVWLGETGAEQHLASTRLRAVESGKWVICATNWGRPAVIDPRGAIVASLGYGRRGVLRSP